MHQQFLLQLKGQTWHQHYIIHIIAVKHCNLTSTFLRSGNRSLSMASSTHHIILSFSWISTVKARKRNDWKFVHLETSLVFVPVKCTVYIKCKVIFKTIYTKLRTKLFPTTFINSTVIRCLIHMLWKIVLLIVIRRL